MLAASIHTWENHRRRSDCIFFFFTPSKLKWMCEMRFFVHMSTLTLECRKPRGTPHLSTDTTAKFWTSVSQRLETEYYLHSTGTGSRALHFVFKASTPFIQNYGVCSFTHLSARVQAAVNCCIFWDRNILMNTVRVTSGITYVSKQNV